MFETKHIPIHINSMGYKREKVGSEKMKAIKVGMMISPFTAAQASEIPEFKRALFKGTDGEVNPTLAKAEFTYQPRHQRIEMRLAPDQGKPSVTIHEAKVRGFKAMVVSGGQFALKFTATILDVDPVDHAQLKDALFEQRFVTFMTAQAGLFAEADAEERRNSKDAAPVKRGRKSSQEGDEPAAEGGLPHAPDFETDGHEQAAKEGHEPARTLPRRHRRRTAAEPEAAVDVPAIDGAPLH